MRHNRKLVRCPECDSTQVYFRFKTHEFVCRGCGHIWELTKQVKQIVKEKIKND